VTDDLPSYGPIAKALKLDHQRCLFHLKHWAGRTIRQLRNQLDDPWQGILDELTEILEELPPDGGYRLFQLWDRIGEPPPAAGEQATPLYRLRRMLIFISDHWQEYVLYHRRPEVPSTNNATERSIGRAKVRMKTMYGVKSTTGRDTIFELTQLRPLAA